MVTRQQVFLAVAWFASLTDARVCFASVATLAKKARLGTTATRAHLRALELDAYIETDGGRHGGGKFALSKTQVRLAQVAMAHRDTSVSALCRELGINPVTLYRYVGPQGDLEARTSSPRHVSVG